jgi:hypothetical protein
VSDLENKAKNFVIRELVIIVVLSFVTLVCFILGATYIYAFAALNAPALSILFGVGLYVIGAMFLGVMYKRLNRRLLTWAKAEAEK